MRKLVVTTVAAFFALAPWAAPSGATEIDAVRSLDGGGNNLQHPTWGQVGTQYRRIAAPNYADGVGQPVDGPNTRYISNRIFNDRAQNLFSENDVSQWGFAWGQFMDHVFGLRQEVGGENTPIGFDANDPLESFTNDFGALGFSRTPGAPGVSPRQQINTVSSYIDAWNVYGGTDERLEWLRTGPLDVNMSNNLSTLFLPGGYLPRVTARGDAPSAPTMARMGRLMGTPNRAVVAGDVRANENIALTALHTLFAREHNRIADALPDTLSEEQKFQIARRVVGAEEQYITYTEFLPALGVQLAPYRGYNPNVNANLANEFATVGYRAHSMIHGELEPSAPADRYTQAQLDAFEAQGIEVEHEDDEVVLVIPLNVAFGNPDLLRSVGLGPVLQGLGAESEYRNDEQIDNQLRSVLFQVPKPGVDPLECSDGPPLPDCFDGVVDLAAIDIERGRDHGMPYYNALRAAYGLPAKTSFSAITGEATSQFPADPMIDPTDPLDDPNILDFMELRDRAGYTLEPGTDAADATAVGSARRATIAARLRALYGDVNKVDAFVGMSAEPHVAGAEFGELQLAIWKKQFEALRDGDRFFYGSDPVLDTIKQLYGIDFRRTLGRIIEQNTDVDVEPNVFKTAVAPIVRINAGGSAVAQTIGLAGFSSDARFSGGGTWSITNPIAGTTDDGLYQNERWGQFSYSVPIEIGTYDVRFHFAEIWFGTAVAGDCVGKRIFGMDVLETAGVDIRNLDICKAVGPRRALVRTVSGVNVTDGSLDIRSVPGAADNPEVAAIEIVPTPEPPPSPLTTMRINTGGGLVNATIGAFAADTAFSGGSTFSVTYPINGTSDDALYQNERFGQFTYSVPVVNGTYDVRLHFAELWFGTTVAGDCVGKRVFGIDVLDTPGVDLDDLDICRLVGPRTALVQTVSGVNVTDGTLDIRSIPNVENPELVALEVVPAS
jgi:peroxidase